jgi:hypothetical protein
MILLALLAACSSPIVAGGHAAFEEGRLEEAIETWSAAAAEGEVSGVLAYDVGTALYRKGDLPRAIAWLRAAARLRPRDGNVHHNLSLARADLGVGIPEPVGPRAVWMAVVTPWELGLVGVLVAAVGSGLVAFRRRGPGAVWLVAGGIAGGVGIWGGRELAQHPVAVVVEGDVPVRDAPVIEAGERFSLPAGAEVRIERARGPFLLLEDGRGRRGWVPANAVQTDVFSTRAATRSG